MVRKSEAPSTCYQRLDAGHEEEGGAPDAAAARPHGRAAAHTHDKQTGHDHDHGNDHGNDHGDDHGDDHDHDHDHGQASDHGSGHAHDDEHAQYHAHDHHHGHMHRPAPGQSIDRSFLFALAITGLFAIVEVAGGIFSHSLALISDAGHMATDAAALLIGLLAARLARRPASVRKSYGYGRAEVIGAFVNGLAMLAVVVWIVVEAVGRVLAPQAVAGPWVMAIAAVGLVVNLVVLFVLSHGHGNLNSRAAVLHVLGDLLGSVAAIVAGAVVTFTGWTLIDPLLSVLVALLILRSTWRLLMESVNGLMEAVPEGIDYQAVERKLTAIPGVESVHDLHVWQMSSEGRALSAHLLISSHEPWPQVLEEARACLKAQYGIGHITLQPVWPRLARDAGGPVAGHAQDHAPGHDGHERHHNDNETGTHSHGKSQSA